MGGQYLTVSDVAERLSVSKRWVYDHADELGAIRFGAKTIRFNPIDLDRRLRERGDARPAATGSPVIRPVGRRRR